MVEVGADGGWFCCGVGVGESVEGITFEGEESGFSVGGKDAEFGELGQELEVGFRVVLEC